MQRGALNHSAGQLYRFEVSDRRDDTCTADLIRDLAKEGQLFLRGELVGNCPTGCLGGKTEFFLLRQVVDFEHDTIGRYRQVLALRVPIGDIRHYLIDRVAHFDGVGDGKSPLTRSVESFEMRLTGQVLAEHVIEIRIESASGHFPRVLQFECTACGIARIRKQRFFLFLTLLVKRLESLPRKEHFAT